MSPESLETHSVYAIRHRTSGKYYFGQTASSLKDRWLAHLHAARGKRSASGMAAIIRENGPEAFEFVPMLRGLSKTEADEWERTMVERFDTVGTYNFMFTEIARKTCGDRKRGLRASPETKAKMATAQRAGWARLSEPERSARIEDLKAAGVAARAGKRRVRIDGVVRYVDWGPDEDPIEVQRARWRLKAKKAREAKAAKRAALVS